MSLEAAFALGRKGPFTPTDLEEEPAKQARNESGNDESTEVTAPATPESTQAIVIDSIPAPSALNEFPLPLHGPAAAANLFPDGVARIQPKLMS